MKRVCMFIFVGMSILISGCYDQTNLEEVSFTLMLGLDVDEDNNMIVYSSSPVFNKEAKEKVEVQSVKARTIREARNKIDSTVTGITIAGKNQSLLLSMRFIRQKKNWIEMLDLLYREPKQSASPRVILVDGPLSEIFNFTPENKPRLPIHMRKLIDTANRRNITVLTNVQEFRRQIKEKGISPVITEIRKDTRDIKVTGTSLLTSEGKYVDSLSLFESTLLLILQDKIDGDASLSIPVKSSSNADDNSRDYVAINIGKVKRKMKTAYAAGTFQFDVTLNLMITLYSRDFEYNVVKNKDELEAAISKQLQKELTALIAKCQSNRVDPFGFGLYARAYQYPSWKVVQDHWETTFAKAKIQIKTKVEFQSEGVTE
ncbi:Ger(x)C family spore germination protein [Paenibacillus allorhizosphaerae]|uniref:Spore germination protein A3 n=1 Tax=Paenibacillus allorhizosphaerae TaxID=2849866 RepID=A0ABM8V9W3_9BACL|nr:Ger(x)C family spore germination protein [Paenibacillus allorhizosphaerae]CAG7614357.1 Spore germination protein A3 [Paenibacillus allorhizosphaerae]